MSDRSFVLGVNYWPRRTAMHWWKDFDRTEVETEFCEIASLGLQVARIFLFWEDFQPSPEIINEASLANLKIVLDVAVDTGITVMPTFFTGHMSGINWWPAWALTETEREEPLLRMAGGRFTLKVGRDPYADPFMLAAETALVREVCGRFGSHPAIFAWNLSNEPDLLGKPHSWDDGTSWNATLTKEIRKLSTHPVSAGMHLPTLVGYTGFRPDGLSPHNDWLSMHAYSIYYSGTADADPLNSDVVPLASLVTEALGKKPVLLEEFGYASSEFGDVSAFDIVQRPAGTSLQFFANDVDGGHYYSDVLAKLARCGGIGAFAWNFSDYHPDLWTTPPFDTLPHERWFGLTRHDGTVKPSGRAMQSFSEDIRENGVPARSVPAQRLEPEAWYEDPGRHFAVLFDSLRGRL